MASLLPALAVGGAIGRAGGLGPAFLPAIAALCLLAATVLLALLPGRLPTGRFGRANTVTAIRLGLTCVLAAALGVLTLGDALVLSGVLAVSDALAWSLLALATAALLLDGLDGWLARRFQEVSPFGARFDLEVDALFLLILALLVAALGKAGAWVLLAGLWRYLFVALLLAAPSLDRPLPPSRRRKLVFVLQAGLLIACLAPGVAPALGGWLAGLGLALLTWSFSLDLAWLLRNRPTGDRLP